MADDVDFAAAASLDRYELVAGDVLWVRTGAMGGIAMVRPDEAGWLPHTNVLRLRIRQVSELDPAYLLAYLAQGAVLERIRNRSKKSVTTSLSTKTLGDLEIPVPPLLDQQRILAAIEALDQQATAMDEYVAALRKARAQLGRHLTEGTVVLTGGESA